MARINLSAHDVKKLISICNEDCVICSVRGIDFSWFCIWGLTSCVLGSGKGLGSTLGVRKTKGGVGRVKGRRGE